MVNEDELWEAIRTRVRNAGLEIVTFEELVPELDRGKILKKAKTALANKDLQRVSQNLRRLLSHELIDSLMREKGYGFVTNIPALDFIADQLNGCKKLKREYGKRLCITEIALDIYCGDVPDYVGVYSKNPKYLRLRSQNPIVPYEMREITYNDEPFEDHPQLREFYCQGKKKQTPLKCDNDCIDGTCRN